MWPGQANCELELRAGLGLGQGRRELLSVTNTYCVFIVGAVREGGVLGVLLRVRGLSSGPSFPCRPIHSQENNDPLTGRENSTGLEVCMVFSTRRNRPGDKERIFQEGEELSKGQCTRCQK